MAKASAVGEQVSSKASELIDSAKSAASNAASTVMSKASEAGQATKEKASEVLQQAKETATDVGKRASDQISKTAGQVKDKTIELAEGAKEGASSAAEAVSDKTKSALSSAKSTVEDTFERAVYWMTHAEALGDRTLDDQRCSFALLNQALHGDADESKCTEEKDLAGKLAAWRELRGMNRAEAMTKYIAHCTSSDASWMQDKVMNSFPLRQSAITASNENELRQRHNIEQKENVQQQATATA